MLAPAPGMLAIVTVAGRWADGPCLAAWHRFAPICVPAGRCSCQARPTYLLAAGLLVLATSRVLSPQYLFWIVPFAALLAGQGTALLVACLLTTLVYPLNYRSSSTWRPPPVLASTCEMRSCW